MTSTELLDGVEIDRRLGWRLGRSERLARRRMLPHILLPDGAIRFVWTEVETLLAHVPAAVQLSAEAVSCG